MTNQSINKVAVVMSTYNGEKYLAEQIESILAQKDVEIYLYVRDDGSSDGTQKILTEYSQKYDNITVDFGLNIGVGNSFMNALYAVPDSFDYYAFADQDDIWYENKLIEAILLLQSSGKSLYASNQENIDKYGNSLGIRFHDEIYIKPADILGFNMLAGCTIVMTNTFYRMITKVSNRPSSELLKLRIHDVWVVMVASIYDGIIYDERAFIKYRQHENNASGGVKASRKRILKEYIKTIFHKKKWNRRSRLAKEVISVFPEKACEYPDIVNFANIERFKSKRRILKNKKIFIRGTGESKFMFSIKVLLGLL